jgi:hypothetical protein
MTPIQLLLAALADLARSKGQDDIAEYLDLAGTITAATRDDKEQFAALTAEIQAMVAEGRGPTESELTTVRNRRAELSTLIRELP